MIKYLHLTVCYLMSYFLIQFHIIFWRTYSAIIWLVRETGMLVAFSSSPYKLETNFLPSYAMLILSFALLPVLLAEKCIYFYNLSEMNFTFVLPCFMADKHVSTCDKNTTLFSEEINYPNLYLSLSSISNASYSKFSKKNHTLSRIFFHLANIQLCCCNLMWKFRLPLTIYTWAQEKEAGIPT